MDTKPSVKAWKKTLLATPCIPVFHEAALHLENGVEHQVNSAISRALTTNLAEYLGIGQGTGTNYYLDVKEVRNEYTHRVSSWAVSNAPKAYASWMLTRKSATAAKAKALKMFAAAALDEGKKDEKFAYVAVFGENQVTRYRLVKRSKSAYILEDVQTGEQSSFSARGRHSAVEETFEAARDVLVKHWDGEIADAQRIVDMLKVQRKQAAKLSPRARAPKKEQEPQDSADPTEPVDSAPEPEVSAPTQTETVSDKQ